ncbi:MAG: carbon-nitrogen hydrolase family protein [Pseudomonadota bacterium]
MTILSALACQIEIPPTPSVAARDQHRAQMLKKIERQLSLQHHDLVVLPELSSVEYSRASFDNLNELAEPLDGPSVNDFSALAKEFECAVVFGMPRVGKGCDHISHVAIDAQGALIGHFDKLHIAQFGDSMEKEYFERGEHTLVFDVKGIRLAPIICYDIRIPEFCRSLVIDSGAHAILHCGAYARDESFDTWHHFAVTRALENQVYFLSLNRAGDHFGNSVFCAPWVDNEQPADVFAARGEDFRTVTIDTDVIAEVREKYTFLGDRLDSYANLGA